MLGRVVGVLAGLVLIALGVALWRPDLVPHGIVLGVGPFAPYKSEVSGLIAAVGAVVAIAAMQRPRASRARGSPGAPDPGILAAYLTALLLERPQDA